jgi:hypothetical protein
MDAEPRVPIWFFIGGTLLIYGLIILATGLYGLFNPAMEAGIMLNWLHAGIWWGALMAVVGAIYCARFHPWRKQD